MFDEVLASRLPDIKAKGTKQACMIRVVLRPPATVTPGGAVMLAPEGALADRRPDVRHECIGKAMSYARRAWSWLRENNPGMPGVPKCHGPGEAKEVGVTRLTKEPSAQAVLSEQPVDQVRLAGLESRDEIRELPRVPMEVREGPVSGHIQQFWENRKVITVQEVKLDFIKKPPLRHLRQMGLKFNTIKQHLA